MIFAKQIQKMYQQMLFRRVDADGLVHYFSADDFPGLYKESYVFSGSSGQKLQGYFYFYEKSKPGRVVIFEHGFGGGHTAYMKEIELLARNGYRVFSYDHTGCMESGGENSNGFAQSLADLDACLTALKADPVYGHCTFAVMGHSWGAYSTMNIPAFHPDVTHLIAISGPVSAAYLINQNFSGLLGLYRKDIYALEAAANPRYAPVGADESLKKTNAQILLIYSADDKTVSKQMHYDLLRDTLGGRENIRFLLVENKNHNPNYTAEAVQYLDEFTAALANVRKQKKIEPQVKHAFIRKWDWERMTQQDETVWKEIFDTLEK